MTSSTKATASAPSNIAFIKYWGAVDLARAIPANPSISMTLEHCRSRTTVEHLGEEGEHEIVWRAEAGALETAPPSFADRVRGHLDFLRRYAGAEGRFRVATENNFPSAAGIASSASGFAALTLATVRALGLAPSEAELSALARASGSGSASRSVLGGFVEWPFDHEAKCHAQQLMPAEHWDLRDVVALVSSGPKRTSSLDGHKLASTSPYWAARQKALPLRLEAVRRAIRERDWNRLAGVVETEAIDLHCVAMSSNPPIFYWMPGTLAVLEAVREMRHDGVRATSTMDAGANVHVICPAEDEDEVVARLQKIPEVNGLLRDRVGSGPRDEDEHLF